MLDFRSPLDGLRSPLGVRRGVSILSLSAALLAAEASGLAWVTNDEAVSDYGSLTIKDTVTPANNYSGPPFSFDGGPLVFSRASLAKDLGADGLWKYTNHNLMVQSQSFDSASWPKTNITVSQDTVDVVDPDGTNQAAKLTASVDGVSSAHALASGSLTVGGVVRVVAKAGTGSWLQLSNNSWRAWFNLSAGTVGSVQNGTSSIEALGDGWYRCIWTPADQTQTTILRMWITNADNATNYQGNGETLYIYTAQQQATPCHSDEYIATTTAPIYYPKIYRDPTTLDNPRYWPEPIATNLALYASDLTNAAYTKTNCTAAKTATGPDGAANSATTLTAIAVNGVAQQPITSASSQRVTSTFVKRRTGTGAVTLSQGETTGSTTSATNWTNGGGSFDFDTFTNGGAGFTAEKSTAGGTDIAYSTNTVSITQGKLYKIEAVIAATTMSSYSLRLSATSNSRSSTVSFSGTGTKVAYVIANVATGNMSVALITTTTGTIDVTSMSVTEVVETTLTVTSDWTRVNTAAATITNPSLIIKLATSGDAIDVATVQHETGGVVTSPIETLGASVTRAADVVSIANTEWPNQDAAMSYYAKFIPNFVDAGGTNYVTFLNRTSSTEYAQHICSGSSTRVGRSSIGIRDSVAGITTTEPGADDLATSGVERIVRMAYDASGCAGSVDGAAVYTGSVPATLPTLTTLYIASASDGSSAINGPLEIFAAVPRRVSNGDLPTWLAA